MDNLDTKKITLPDSAYELNSNNRIKVKNLNCPYCRVKHLDIDLYAMYPHRTHTCLECKENFDDSEYAVSYPIFSSDFYKRFIEFNVKMIFR